MNTQIHKVGETLTVAIPAAIAAQAELSEGMEVSITSVDGKLVLTPQSSSPTLEELLAEVTPENLHEEIDLGEPVGQEVW